MYKLNGKIRKTKDVKAIAYDFASMVAKGGFQPDRVWVLDTCETAHGDMCVLEVNCFSNSDWYRCDVESVVTSVSRVALDDWNGRRSAKIKRDITRE